MAVLTAFLVILALVVILGLVVLTTTRQARAGRSSVKDFEIIGWNGRPAQPMDGAQKKKVAADFTGALRWQNQDALCLLTGVRVADCGCDTHRSPE